MFGNRDCIIIMGDLIHVDMKWKSLECTVGNNKKFMFRTQDQFLQENVSESTKGNRI